MDRLRHEGIERGRRSHAELARLVHVDLPILFNGVAVVAQKVDYLALDEKEIALEALLENEELAIKKETAIIRTPPH